MHTAVVLKNVGGGDGGGVVSGLKDLSSSRLCLKGPSISNSDNYEFSMVTRLGISNQALTTAEGTTKPKAPPSIEQANSRYF